MRHVDLLHSAQCVFGCIICACLVGVGGCIEHLVDLLNTVRIVSPESTALELEGWRDEAILHSERPALQHDCLDPLKPLHRCRGTREISGCALKQQVLTQLPSSFCVRSASWHKAAAICVCIAKYRDHVNQIEVGRP